MLADGYEAPMQARYVALTNDTRLCAHMQSNLTKLLSVEGWWQKTQLYRQGPADHGCFVHMPTHCLTPSKRECGDDQQQLGSQAQVALFLGGPGQALHSSWS